MLKALRRRFILISMALVFVVMTIVLLVGLVTNHLQFTREYEAALNRELAIDIRRQPRNFFRTNLPGPDQAQSRPKLSFTAEKDTDGTWQLITPWMELDPSTFATLYERVEEASSPRGYWSDLGIAYFRQEERIAFVNLQNEQAQLHSSQLAWALVYLGALGIFFFISIVLSRGALKPVETAWFQQQRFVSDASHELRTPLTVILANLDILESEQGSNQWLSTIRTEGLLMKKLIENLLFLAHSDEARKPVQKQKINLSNLVSETVLAFEAMAYEKGLMLESDILPEQIIQGDAGLLRQLLTILLDNAVKYTPHGGNIQVLLKKSRDKLSVSVRNSKSFIPPEHLAHLSDRFYRMDPARTKGEGGYGLGLSIATEIAQLHGATLKAISDEETGTAFILTL